MQINAGNTAEEAVPAVKAMAAANGGLAYLRYCGDAVCRVEGSDLARFTKIPDLQNIVTDLKAQP